MKRRKKGGQAPKEQAANAPEPLQPKYFEAEAGHPPAEHGAETMPAEAMPAEPESPVLHQPASRPSPPRSMGERSLTERPARERSTEQRSAEQRSAEEKETQADFQLGTRRIPELPLAEAVQNEGRPSRRRRKRGGRGGVKRSPGGAPPASGARVRPARSVTAAEPPVPGVIAVDYQEPLTPESAGDEPAIAAPMPEVATEIAAQTPVTQSATPATITPIPTAPGAAAPGVAARPSKGTVVLAIGLPGSGKSSWFKRHNIHPLSSDLLRELLFDDALEQRFQDLVFSNLRSMLKARLIARRPMNYVDATNLTPHDRHSWIKLAKDYGYDVQGLFFDVPLEICLERHQKRGRAVPEDIMRKMAGKLKPPTFEEGFSKITVVRVKQKKQPHPRYAEGP